MATTKMPQVAAGEAFWVVYALAWRPAVASFLLPTAIACSFAAGAAAPAADQGWATLSEENNNLGSDSDRYYVNGVNLAYLSGSLAEGRGWADRIERRLPVLFAADGKRDVRYEWTVLGQQIFTPADKSLTLPDPSDRPYAAWLYTGVNLLQDVDSRRLDDLQATLGLVGPDALGRQVQNSVHKLFGFGKANGWSHQLRDEPAVTIGYSRTWRFGLPLSRDGGLAADVLPELGATLGNVNTYAEATGLVRLGRGLEAGYGPRLLRPGATGGGYFNPDCCGGWGYYAFAGWQGRAVGHNLFLDGNTFRDSPSVPKYPWVHDFVAGVSLYGWRSARVDMTYIRRSEEFHAQQGSEAYGSTTVSVRW